MLLAIATALSIIGAFSVALGRPTIANLLWTISNPILARHNLIQGEIEQFTLFLVFTTIAIIGVLLWLFGNEIKAIRRWAAWRMRT